MNSILGIDPGPSSWAWALLDGETVTCGVATDWLDSPEIPPDTVVVIESVMPRQQPLGHELLDTIRTEERIAVGWAMCSNDVVRLPRNRITAALIDGGNKGADARIRAVLIDRWGGGSPRKASHPLHAVTGDCWAALAAAVCYQDTAGKETRP